MAGQKRLNVVFMLSDQLRSDCVGSYGNPIIRTPHIDGLAAEGTRFDQAFAQHPQCVPSRAAIFTGRYPHVNGAISNFTAPGEHETTLPEYFRSAGYRTIAVGKLHLYEQKEKAGFTDTMMSGGQHSGATDPECLREDYKAWLKEKGYWEETRRAYAIHGTPEYWDDFQANVNPMPQEACVDSWVGDMAVDYIRNQARDEPFFLFAGFPNPHIPFDAPEPYASMYDPKSMPIPPTFGKSLEDKPPQHLGYKRKGRRVNYENLTEEKLARCMAYYYGSISLVDDQVGKILAALEERDFMQNTVIVFVSDHGELLGHYGMLIKSIDAYPMLYDVGLKVPCIVKTPAGPAGHVVSEAVELIDLCPTVLESAGLEVPPELQGMCLAEAIAGGSAPPRDFVFAETGAVKMLRGKDYKLVHYPGQTYGELYDIRSDPHETQNLYNDPVYAELRADLTRRLADRLIATEAGLHGESQRGPAYWKTMYSKPFE